MDKTLKDFNNLMIEYTMANTRSVMDFNAKMVNDYMEMSKTIVGMFPGLEAYVPAYAKR